ncbi:MAG: peptide deformylase [Paracoccaceae bacterium]
MAVLPIVKWPDPRLRERAEPADVDALRDVIPDMFETMYAANGRGLAGPQVGVMARVFVMDCAWKEGEPDPRAMLNPFIMAADHTPEEMVEGCLSIPDVPVPVSRPRAVTVQWTDETGQIHMDDFDRFEARCIQHELDHLNGIVIFDRIAPDLREELETPYLETRA